MAEVKNIPIITAEEYQQQGYFKDVAPLIKQAHAHDLFVVGMASSQTLNFMVQYMGDAEAAMMAFYDDPELALALINRAVEISLEKARAFIEAGADCIYIGDSYASGSVISPDTYHRFCAPAYRDTAAEIHRMGVLCYKHCCGDYNPLLAHLPETGIDGMDGIDPTSGMSVAHTKAMVGDTITLMGGISCLNLLNGTPEEVYAEATACIEAGKPGGRYILGSACAVPRFSPPENLLAAGKVAVEVGGY
jgi:uroporphyrinogen decarboxylase